MEDEEGNQVRRRNDSSGGSRAEAKEETALDALENGFQRAVLTQGRGGWVKKKERRTCRDMLRSTASRDEEIKQNSLRRQGIRSMDSCR